MINSEILYLECNAGISGDMTVAALLDLGADEAGLRRVLESIPVSGFRIEIGRVKKSGIDCCDFRVILDAEHENHDHDMEYLHGDFYKYCEREHHGHEGHEHCGHEEHAHHENHEHHEEHEHHENHVHHENHAHHEHGHHGDSMAYITEIIERTNMPESARQISLHIFDILAEAEARAHAVPREQVHFHEVGAVDSIVDVIATAVCLDELGIKHVIIPKLCEGVGTVRCRHGVLPVPVPAVANIVQEHGLSLEIMGVQGEFVTPTGAAIAAAIRTEDNLPKRFQIQKIGLGAGKRTYERPSILRAMLIETVDEEQKAEDYICKLETNIDDCSGETLGYVMEKLFDAGAKDVHYHPVYMKKNRPGWQLNVICGSSDAERLEEIIFKETTTIGIRHFKLERSVLPREQKSVDTPYGRAAVKLCALADGTKRFYPEYESVVEICKRMDISYNEAYHVILQSCFDEGNRV